MEDVAHDPMCPVMHTHHISLARRHRPCISTDTEFAAKAADVVGLFLDPPRHAIVRCVDEKPSIPALERARSWLLQPNDPVLNGR